MNTYKVLFTAPMLTNEGRKYLESNDCVVAVRYIKDLPEEERISELLKYDAVIAAGEEYNRNVLFRIKDKIKIIARHGMGTDAIDLEAADEYGILVTNTPNATTTAVAEMVVTLILCYARDLYGYINDMKNGIWQQKRSPINEIKGRTIGIVGVGQIGKETVRLLSSFGCRFIGYDIKWDNEFANKYNIKRAELNELMKQSDFISISVNLSKSTYGLIGKTAFEAANRRAVLINTSRGYVVDREALIDALKTGRIAGAALDVHWQTPVAQDDELVQMSNVIATPHIGFNTVECVNSMVMDAAQEVVSVLSGKKPRFEVHAFKG